MDLQGNSWLRWTDEYDYEPITQLTHKRMETQNLSDTFKMDTNEEEVLPSTTGLLLFHNPRH